jgi:GNAT superfamily N-acetyltransferase
VLEEWPLDPAVHDRQGFDCGVPALNDYLQRLAGQHRRQGLSAVYVLVDEAAPPRIPGCYTLRAAEVAVDRLGEADRQRLPCYPLPCFRHGRLACRADEQERGLGRLLHGGAVERCLKAREQVVAHALVVDAKDERAQRFYTHFGFRPLQDAVLTLYLPLGR